MTYQRAVESEVLAFSVEPAAVDSLQALDSLDATEQVALDAAQTVAEMVAVDSLRALDAEARLAQGEHYDSVTA